MIFRLLKCHVDLDTQPTTVSKYVDPIYFTSKANALSVAQNDNKKYVASPPPMFVKMNPLVDASSIL